MADAVATHVPRDPRLSRRRKALGTASNSAGGRLRVKPAGGDAILGSTPDAARSRL